MFMGILLCKVATNFNGTAYRSQLRKAVDALELAVVGDLKGATNLLEHREGDVRELIVVGEDERASAAGPS